MVEWMMNSERCYKAYLFVIGRKIKYAKIVLPIAKVLQILGATIFLLCCGAKLR
jgi:hypothetical protein